MISSLTNPKVKYISALNKGTAKGRKNEIVIEGTHLVEEALKSQKDGRSKLNIVFYTGRYSESKEGKTLLGQLGKAGVELEEITEKVMSHLSEVETPQGVMALASLSSPDYADFFKQENPAVLILDGIQDPGNLGTIIRVADAFGASGILMSDRTVNPNNPKVVRSTAGSVFNVGLARFRSLIVPLKDLRRRGIKIVATDAAGPKTVSQVDLKGPVGFIFGSEGQGIEEGILKLADELVSIPMTGKVESLNVAVSASIVLYEMLRQRRGKGNG